MSAEECARRFRAIQRMGNDPYVRHMGHLTNRFMSWNRTNECVLLTVGSPLCVCVHICRCVCVGNTCMFACATLKSVSASEKKREERNNKWRERGDRGDWGGWFPRSSCQVCRRSCGGKCNPLRYCMRSLIYMTFWNVWYLRVFTLKWQNLCRLLVGQEFEQNIILPTRRTIHPDIFCTRAQCARRIKWV